MNCKPKILLSSFLTVILLLGFAVPANMVGNWYQQFMPSPTGGAVRDIYFVDSLLGFAVSDSSILKTTNGGDNWSVKHSGFYIFERIQFLNRDTGFACGGNNKLLKTVNSGENWTIMIPSTIYPFDMAVLSTDTIWLVDNNSFVGGVFRTTNGGASWDHQFSGGNQNPNKLYMFNTRIGFMSNSSSQPNIYRTTNSGVNWNVVVSGQYFRDMQFTDSLTGWYAFGNNMYKTTNEGLNWSIQYLPNGGNLVNTAVFEFALINADTLYGVGGVVAFNTEIRGIIYRTTDSGNNWQFQYADTTIHIPVYYHIKFIGKKEGWCYNTVPTGIHTTTGGDLVWLTGIQQVSTEVPKSFHLFQNYPNPFNPVTNIKYQAPPVLPEGEVNVRLTVYDIQGREIAVLVDQKQNPGTYQVDFNGNGYSSGVYFYQLSVDGIVIDTKKMVLVK